MQPSSNALWRVVAARLISRTGGEAAFFVGIWGKAAYEFEGTAGQIAWVIAALGVSGLIGSALAGVLIDRSDPRRVMLLSEVVFVPVALSLVFVESLPALVAVSFLLGLVSSPTFTSIASFPPFITSDEEELAKANALVETAGMAALITGTAAGAALAAWVGIDAIFVLDAATSLVAVGLVYGVRLRTVEHQAREEGGGGLAELREGFRYSFGHDRLRFYLLIGAAVWLLFGLFSAIEPLFYRDVLERGPETIGWVNTLFGIGLVAGTLGVARLPERLRGARTVLALTACNGVGAMLYVGTANLLVVVAGGMIWGFVIGLFAPIVRTMLHLNSPEPMIGRVTSVSQVMAEVGKLLPLLFAPTLAAAVGVQAALISTALALSALALAFWRVAARLDRTRVMPVPQIATGTVADEPISTVP